MRRPFRSAAPEEATEPSDDAARESPAAAAADDAPGHCEDVEPQNPTESALRLLFRLDAPSPVVIAGRGAPTEPPQTPLYADLVCNHFDTHRPDLPSFPTMATRVIDAAEQSDSDLGSLGRLIEQDTAISARVLRMANSALYRRGAEIQTVTAAVSQLGAFAVANVAVSVACTTLYDPDVRAEFDLFPSRWRQLFLQSMTVAYTCSEFSAKRRVGRPDRAFLSGMFHDVGKTMALRSLCSLILEGRIARLDEAGADAVLERTHVQVGTEAHAAWQLPGFLSTVCHRHHDEEVAGVDENAEINVVRVVSGINAVRTTGRIDPRLVGQIHSSVSALGLADGDLQFLAVQLQEAGEHVEDLFGGAI